MGSRNNAIWATNDKFWIDLKPIIFDASRLTSARTECEKIIELANINVPGNILDAGCGIGRHALCFAKQGFNVDCIDRVPSLVREAENNCIGKNISVHYGDILTYNNYTFQPYDLVVSLYHSLGYDNDPDVDIQTLARITKILKFGGKAFFELINPEGFEPDEIREFTSTHNSISYTETIQISQNRKQYNLTITPRNSSSLKYCITHRLFFADEITRMLQNLGFSVNILPIDDLIPYEGSSKKMYVLAELQHDSPL